MFLPSRKRSRLALRTWNNFVCLFVQSETENEFYHNHSRCAQTPTYVTFTAHKFKGFSPPLCGRQRRRRKTLKWYLIDHDPIWFEFWDNREWNVRIGARTHRKCSPSVDSPIRWLCDGGREGVHFTWRRWKASMKKLQCQRTMCLNLGGRPQSAFAFIYNRIITNIPLSDNN